MANIFENQLKTKIPANLSECVEIDNTAKELFKTAASIEIRARISAGIVAVIGIITSILILAENYNSDSAYVFYIGILITAIISYIVYYPQHFNALQMRAFATIVNNTTTSANLQMYYFQTRLGEKIIIKDPPKDIKSWTCPQCSNENEGNIHVCTKCGYDKKTPVDNFWVCPQCNSKNLENTYVCANCGYDLNDTTEDDYITLLCPTCNKELYFKKDTAHAHCPHCDAKINI